eukprot:9490077-Pyramimonas_sp.AAC.1
MAPMPMSSSSGLGPSELASALALALALGVLLRSLALGSTPKESDSRFLPLLAWPASLEPLDAESSARSAPLAWPRLP